MGGSSGGDEKMKVETMWMLFAMVAMSFFFYAFLKPMCDNCCTFRKKKPVVAEVVEEPKMRTIKIHPARAQFRLFPPGEAYYVGGPKKVVEPKPKKKKKTKVLNEKWKQCVQNIVISNAIRDLASPLPRPAFTEDGESVAPKDPRVFSGLSNIPNGRLKLNGGPMNNFAKIVQLARMTAQRDRDIAASASPDEEEGRSVKSANKEDAIETAVEIKDDEDEPIARRRPREPSKPQDTTDHKTHEAIDMGP